MILIYLKKYIRFIDILLKCCVNLQKSKSDGNDYENFLFTSLDSRVKSGLENKSDSTLEKLIQFETFRSINIVGVSATK